jgi:hypothetical protein
VHLLEAGAGAGESDVPIVYARCYIASIVAATCSIA